ncbi:MAG: DEAD/DEAH box helicase, partial [Chloroflexi bacterium]|nr:DEAD/DEAH box helicase [Chloroflexota bacterium]
IRSIVQGWIECLGPTTAQALAARLGLSQNNVDMALALLEADGLVLQGRFTPGEANGAVEWCDRRLLARIHRLTLGRLRREIESVSAVDFIRFLLRWQHVYPGSQLHGREGILQVIGQLQGLELPAPAWERDVLPARIAQYNPADLEALCLSGHLAWGRLRPHNGIPANEDADEAPSGAPRRLQRPTRSAPLAFVLREDLPHFTDPSPISLESINGLSVAAREVASYLEEKGASFLTDIARGIGRLPAQVEEALWELVACGLVTGDGIAGLRSLLMSSEKRERYRRFRAVRGGMARQRLMPVGRWALLRTEPTDGKSDKEESAEIMARQLLRRYGVVFRDLLAREGRAPSWRVLLNIYRRMEARGEIRGGRFVAGFVGEQFALPEAVEVLRMVRRRKDENETVIVASADPLNLVGVLTPGARVSPLSNQVITYQNGVPVDVGDLGAVRHRLHARGSAVPA